MQLEDKNNQKQITMKRLASAFFESTSIGGLDVQLDGFMTALVYEEVYAVNYNTVEAGGAVLYSVQLVYSYVGAPI
jgi:hypothetical protein